MFITKKAAIGFILLGIIVFSVSSYDTANPIKPPAKQTVIEQDQMFHIVNTDLWKSEYHPPLVNLGKLTPYAITAVMELFALICYLFLKRIEPRINAWAEETRKRVKEERKQIEEDHE